MSPTIVFEVDLTLSRNETIGPKTNERSTGVLSPDMAQQNKDLGREQNSVRKFSRSTWNPGLNRGDNINLKHGDQFTVVGKKAIYLRDTYAQGYAEEGQAVLKIVSYS